MPLKWRDVLTERDGETPCFVRILTIAGVLGYVALTGYAVFRGQSVGYAEWAVGFSTIVAGGAGAARLKLETEGEAPEDAVHDDAAVDRTWK